jgi:hypothetical protein
MTAVTKPRPSGQWTAEEVEAEERAQRARLARDALRTPEERLEATLRLSAVISELRAGIKRDVSAR